MYKNNKQIIVCIQRNINLTIIKTYLQTKIHINLVYHIRNNDLIIEWKFN